MAILPVTLTLPSKLHPHSLSYTSLSSFSSSADNLSISLSSLSLHHSNTAQSTKLFIVRMGGGPRTFPGGVSKWQWKRMQNKKAKQLLKARLMRERQIYEMRKRAELKAAVSELERPWQVVEQAAPNLFSVAADEQLKVLADRFQKPGGFDLWSEKDGPQLFETPDGLPTARFFPKGVVHSIKPYGRVDLDDGLGEIENEIDDLGMNTVGRLKGGSNSGFDREERLFVSRNSTKQGRDNRNFSGSLSESDDSDEESSYSLNSRGFSSVNRQSGQQNIDQRGIDNPRGRSLSRRFSGTEYSNGESSYSSNSRVSTSVNQRRRSIDQRGTGSPRDRNQSRRFSVTEDSNGESSYSSNSRAFATGSRRQGGQRNIDQRGTGSRRDLSGMFGESERKNEEGSYTSNSRVFSGINRHQSGRRNLEQRGSGSRGDGDFRKNGNGKSVGSRDANGAIKYPESGQSVSSARERRESSRPQIDGYNRSRRDSRLDKRRSSSSPEDVYDLSLQRDGSYSLGSH